MKKRLLSLALVLTMLMTITVFVPTSASADSGIIAFPGAEGAGKYATGGRGGKIYHVTNLNDSGEGSFRDAVSGYNRVVVFDIGGTITLKSDVVVKGNVTILGQTAPGGGGITLSGGKLGQGGSNQIIRFVSSRPGERGGGEYDAWGGNDGSNSIVDHCSLGWGNDEQWGLYSNNMNQTVQYSIIGPSNCVSTHAKGFHGFGVMFGKGNCTWHHNMIAHNASRNFRGKVEKTNAMDFVNNVLYDWGYQTGYGTLGHINYVGNYLKAGGSTKGAYHFFVRSSGTGIENYKFYVTGNKIQKKDGSAYSNAINSNNWEGVGFDKSTYGSDVPFAVYDVNGNDASVAANAQTADDAFETVLSYAGAGIDAASRPRIDREVMEEARTGSGYLTGGGDFDNADSKQKQNIKSYNIQKVNYEEYYPGTVQKTITDSDNDGMPDEWELARGLNPNDASDASGDYLGQGYMNIEYYANDLTVNAFPQGVVELSPQTADLGPEYTNAKEDIAALSISPATIKTAADLILPQTGSLHGTPITWTSSSSAIKISGNQISSVNRGDNDKAVTLTAAVSAGGFKINRAFTVTVTGSSVFWKANADVTSGSTLFEGLTPQFDGTYKAAAVNNSGVGFDGYLTGTTGGKFENGAATGTSFKFTAPSNGYITAYATSLGSAPSAEKPDGNKKTLCITPEGASGTGESVAAVNGLGISTCCTAAVEQGKTYYIYVSGSNGRFNGIKFSENAPKEQVKAYPIRWNFSEAPFIVDGKPDQGSFPEGALENRYVLETDAITPENYSGLKFTVSENIDNSYTGARKTYDDGLSTTWEIKTGGGGDESNKFFSFFPAEDGTVTVYAHSGSGSNTSVMTIYQGGASKTLDMVGFNSEPEILPTLSMPVTGGTEVKIYASGNTGYAAIGYYNESYVEPTPGPTPTATPEPTPKPPLDESRTVSWNFSEEPFVTGGAVNTAMFPAGSTECRYKVTPTSVSNVNGLTYVTKNTDDNQFQSSKVEFADGTKCTWSLKTSKASADGDRVFTYTPAENGVIRVYAKSGSGSKDSGINIKQGGKTLGKSTYTAGEAAKMDEIEVSANEQAVIESTGNTQFYALKFVPFGTAASPEPTGDPHIYNAYTENGNTVVECSELRGQKAIAVKYDDNGALVDVKFKDIPVNYGLESVIIEGIEADKVMVWSDLDTIAPGCSVYEISNR